MKAHPFDGIQADSLSLMSCEQLMLDPVASARALLNCFLVREIPGISERLVIRITETEIYTADDAASHSYRGKTVRNQAMFGMPGDAYVYRIYGIHHCVNVVCSEEGAGAAILIRSGQPVCGLEPMAASRGLNFIEYAPEKWLSPIVGRQLTGGPGKLCQALQIDAQLNGVSMLKTGAMWLARSMSQGPITILETPRIGITRDTNLLRRFLIAEDGYTSRRR